MPRIRQNADKYAAADLVGELAAQMSRAGLTQEELGGMIGLSQPTVSKYLRYPGIMPMEVFRQMVAVLNPDPVICLTFLKFGKKAIKSLERKDT